MDFGLWGPLGRALGALLGLLGGFLGASWGRLGAEGFKYRLVFPLLGASLGPPGPPWERILPFWGRLGPVLSRLGVLLGASWAVLGRFWRLPEPAWSVGNRETREGENAKTVEKHMGNH